MVNQVVKVSMPISKVGRLTDKLFPRRDRLMRYIMTLGLFREKRASGFTLIELTVVVLLLSVFLVISVPLFSRFGASNLGSSAKRLSGTIKYLFNESALTGLQYRLIYNLDQGTYRAQVLERDGELVEVSGPGRQTALAGKVRFRDLQVPGRGTFTAGEVTTLVHPSGWVEETVIHLIGDTGEILTLRVMPLSGTTEMLEGDRVF